MLEFFLLLICLAICLFYIIKYWIITSYILITIFYWLTIFSTDVIKDVHKHRVWKYSICVSFYFFLCFCNYTIFFLDEKEDCFLNRLFSANSLYVYEEGRSSNRIDRLFEEQVNIHILPIKLKDLPEPYTKDEKHLFGDFYIGMPMYYFLYKLEKNGYNIIDDKFSTISGVFSNKNLAGITIYTPCYRSMEDQERNNSTVDSLTIAKLTNLIQQKYGPSHYNKGSYQDRTYQIWWLFSEKHITIGQRGSEVYVHIYSPQKTFEKIYEERKIFDLQQKKATKKLRKEAEENRIRIIKEKERLQKKKEKDMLLGF